MTAMKAKAGGLSRREALRSGAAALAGGAATMAFGSSTSALAFALQRTRAKIKDVQTMMMQGGRTYTLVRIVADNGATLLEEPSNALAHLLRFYLALEHVSMTSLLEFRTAHESWMAAAAARRRPEQELAEAEETLERMETEDLSEREFLEVELGQHLIHPAHAMPARQSSQAAPEGEVLTDREPRVEAAISG